MRDRRRAMALTIALAAALASFPGCSSQEQPVSPGENGSRPETIRMAVSASAMPLAELLTSRAEEALPDLDIVMLPPMHSSGAAAATHLGEADLGFLSRPIKAEEEALGLEYLHMARDGLVFATHHGVAIEDLSSEQIRGIYSGEIRNWKELGGPDGEIVVLDRPEHTSPKILLRNVLFGADLAITEDALVLERPATVNVSLETVPFSVGYTSLGGILISGANLNVLDLDGVSPTPQNVEANLYPLARFLGIVIRSEPRPEVMPLLEFVYSERGERIMTDNGYSPTLLNLVIATVPERSVVRQEDRYRPLAEYLSGRLGGKVKVRLKHLPAYEMVVDEFVNGSTNLAFFGSYTYALTLSRTGVRPVARPEKDGVSEYRGLILARKDARIRDWRDLRGKRVAMILDTTAGDLFPRVFLKRHGVDDVESFFGEIFLAGSHDTSIRKLLAGEVDVAAAKDLVYLQMAREDTRIHDELTILAESAPVPDNALVVGLDLQPSCFTCHEGEPGEKESGPPPDLSSSGLAGRLRAELLALEESPEGRVVLESLGADRFLETTHEDYANLYEMIEELGIDLAAHGD